MSSATAPFDRMIIYVLVEFNIVVTLNCGLEVTPGH